MIVLGIETSCDETAASVVKDGSIILSSVIASQVEVHHLYGGVVPEIASRKHIEAIFPVVDSALKEAGIDKSQIDAVAVTQGPGLIGALLVGFSYAKAFAFAQKIPFTGINHLEGHITSVFLSSSQPEFPYIALLVSGGHTSIYYVKSHIEFEIMGQTRDDAAGEAYDKVSKMLGLGYPGGIVIDSLAKNGNPKKIKFPRSWLDKSGFDFSFSGLKTAVRRYIELQKNDFQNQLSDIAAGFQEAVVDVLTFKTINAALRKKCKHLAVVGGVAANSRLREKISSDAKKKGIQVHIPPVSLCGDNAAMIAAAGFHYLNEGRVSDITDDVYSRAKSPPGQKHR